MSTTLKEKVIDILENSDFNSLPYEERKKIIKYNKEQRENEKLIKLSEKVKEKSELEYKSHANENEGDDIY